ncbi:MAG: hypothetical protein HY461_00900 [Parcubacteria group bacterium]|nr:hypothetical protein [Parcubacteria group bacterium]
MPNQQLLDYIKQCQEQGIDKPAIRQALVDAGWAVEEIDGALTPKKKHRIRQVALITIVVIVVIAALVYFSPTIFSWFVSDIEAANDGDLALKTLSIPKEQNAFFDGPELAKLTTASAADLNDYIYGRRWDDDEVQAILARHEAALAKFKTVVSKPYWQDPNYATSDVDGKEVVLLTVWRSITTVSLLHALSLAKGGQGQEAVAEMVALAEFGHRIHSGQNSLLEYLIGLAIQNRALEALQQVATSTLDSASAIAAQQAVAQLSVNASDAIKADHQYQSFWLEEGAKEYNDYSLQPNRTKYMMAAFSRDLIRSAAAPCDYQVPERVVAEYPFNLRAYIKNGVGKAFYERGMSMDTTIKKSCETQVITNATQVVLALKAYEIDHGQLPERLDQLVPQYVETLPLDPYSKKPFGYLPAEKAIYSVGSGRLDRGGTKPSKSNDNRWQGQANPTFYLE